MQKQSFWSIRIPLASWIYINLLNIGKFKIKIFIRILLGDIYTFFIKLQNFI